MLRLYWQQITNLAQAELQSQYLEVVDNINVKNHCMKMIRPGFLFEKKTGKDYIFLLIIFLVF